MTPNQDRLVEILHALYPDWIRQAGFDVWTVTYNYDVVRWFLFGMFQDWLEDWVKGLTVQSANSAQLTLWEELVWLPIDMTASIEVRKARVLARLITSRGTISNIKSVIQAVVGWDESAFAITEKWKISDEVTEVWDYIVSIYDRPEWFSEEQLQDLLEKVQPAHCTAFIETTPTIEDVIGLRDEITKFFTHRYIAWLDWDNLPTTIEDEKWWDDYYPPSGFLWA